MQYKEVVTADCEDRHPYHQPPKFREVITEECEKIEAAPCYPDSCAPIITEAHGQPMIVLNPNSKWSVSFGLNKAKEIMKWEAHIRAFIASDGTSVEP